MKRKSLIGVVCLAIGLLLTTQITSARYELKVNESETRFSFSEPTTAVPPVIESGAPQPLVRPSTWTEVNVNSEAGAGAEKLAVAAVCDSALATTSASVNTKTSLRYVAPTAATKQQFFTPRPREYFPETLLWNPELTTDKKGRAQLDFKLADNITTGKMSVIGSTSDGEITTAETKIRSFQPFFANLDPPRVLTEGDRISLPVVLRNYLDLKQAVTGVIIRYVSNHWSCRLTFFICH
jgi:hypothetical protein